MEEMKPSLLSPLVLAYIGDGVYELYVRNRIISEHSDMPPHKLHILSTKHVKAHAQSSAMNVIESVLTETETAIYKRGRNAKSATAPKNADIVDYRKATGFEALVGYLYLQKDNERLKQIMQIAYDNSQDTEIN